MNFVRTSVGIEITTDDLRIAVLRRTAQKIRLIHTGEVPGFVRMSGEERVRELKALVTRLGLSSSRAYLSLPREQGIARQLDLPIEVRDKLQGLVALQVEALMPWPIAEVYWDFAHVHSGKNAKALSVTVAIIPKETLDPWIALFGSVGLTLSGASLSSTVCAHGASVLWGDAQPSLVLGCEPNYVESALISGGRLTAMTLAGSDTPRLCHSAVEKTLSLGRVGNPEAVRVVLCGSAASFESAEPAALPLENTAPDSGRKFGVIAAALAAFKKTPFGLNLVPPSLRFQRNHLQLIPTYALIGLTVAMGIMMILREPYQMSGYASRIDEEVLQIGPSVQEVSAQEAELNRLSEKYRALAGHLQGRDQNLESLLELSRVLPSDVWLTSYFFQNAALTISGYAASASTVQKAVEDSALFKDVQFSNSVTREPSGKDRFTLKAAIEVRK